MPTLTTPLPLIDERSDGADGPAGLSLEQLLTRCVGWVVGAYVGMQCVAFVLTDAVQPISGDHFLFAMLTGLSVTAAGAVALSLIVRRVLNQVTSHEQSHSLWSFIDYTSVGLALVPGLTVLITSSLAGGILYSAGTGAPAFKLLFIGFLLACAVFPGLNVVLCLLLGRLASLRNEQLLESVGRRARSMLGLGTRIGMAVVFCALLPLVWLGMVVARSEADPLTTTLPTLSSGALAGAALMVVALFNALAFRSWILHITSGLGAQLAQLHSGSSARPPFLGLDEAGSLTGDAAEAAARITDLAQRMQRIADGDLTVHFSDNGALAVASRRIREALLGLVDSVAVSAVRLQDDAHAVLETTLDVEGNAQEQALNVDESRRTMQGLRQCSNEINTESRELVQASEDVFSVNENTASQIGQLVEHQVQIEELLDTVREIAERSDILALNASLEGVRAGESGRGFSLVAAEMRRMAEKVKSAANDIRQIVTNVRSSARNSMMAIEEAKRVGDRMQKSVERILLMASQQTTSTSQVANNMADVAGYLQQATGDTAHARELAESLANHAGSLLDLVDNWILPEPDEWGPSSGTGGSGTGGVQFDSDDNISFRPSGRQPAATADLDSAAEQAEQETATPDTAPADDNDNDNGDTPPADDNATPPA